MSSGEDDKMEETQFILKNTFEIISYMIRDYGVREVND